MTSNSTQGGPWDSNGNGGSGLGGIYDAEYFMPYEVSVNNGLTLNAEQKSVLGANYVNGAVVPQTFPVTAGVVDTYGKVEFNGGYLQISMKQPGGAGSWPGLWLLPASGAGNVGNNFEIDIQEGGFTNGSANPNDTFSYHLHTPVGTFGGVIDTGVDLTAGFHTYAINWVPGQSITWYLDGKQMAQITSAEAPIPNEPMELIMCNQVATSAASSWRTSMDSSTPQSMQILVNDVQLYQKAGSGDTIMGSNVSAPTATVPTVAITSAGGTVAQASQAISGTVDIADAGSTVKILDGTAQVGTAVVGADGKWSTNVTLAHTGANVLTATDSNVAGTGTSNAVTFNLTTAAPTVAITSAGGTVAQASQTISGTVDIADAGSTVKILDGTAQVGTAVVGADGKWSTNVTLAHTGANVLTATDSNVAGTGTSNAVTFNLTTVAPTAPITPTAPVTPTTPVAPVATVTNINSSSGNQTLALGDNPYAVNLNGYYNVVTAGGGNDTVIGGGGNNNVTLGDGSDTVTLGGYYNVVTAGNGKNAINAGAGNATVVAGNGANLVTLAGWNNSVTLGGGTNVVSGGQGNATIVAGGGANTITLAGWNNSVTLGAGANVVNGGQGNDTIILTGGAATLRLGGNNETAILGGGVNATIFDTGSGLRIAVDTSSGANVINGFAQDRNGYIELRNNAGGYSSVSSILGALKSDGNGGTLLALGATGSIDIAGVTPDKLSANNFRISTETDASMAPTLTIADPSLNVAGGGGTVPLGVKVAASASATDVKVTIAGLPSYETISDGLGHTYSGQSIPLSAAEVNSGLTLTSHYTGSQHPIATLSVSASDTIGGAVATSAKQSIVVVDPPPMTPASTANAVALLNQYIAGGFEKDQGAAPLTTKMAAAFSHDESFLSRPGHS
ncbi:family 16 glycosylhydrolase [Rhodoblastus sp. 17X3]|uniref:family 16 glycosylhydrolase n=1 Tax=Rhodoblastus sp. 17X3 TaxID=3047026 RepID=UPI0024B727DE|nr:family 16 glycosylhydrolase [Rhodoblastus sp. 17X3]MDI9846471.1 family 16 glycosylhydrolase [Rhodoblastus sp. 17X3]